MIRAALYLYLAVSLAMIATSLYTGRRATRITGREHYMFTTTHLLVDEEVPADNPADEAFDAATREAGQSTRLPVDRPIFVLGFADATAPGVLVGGLALTIAWAWSRRGRRSRDSSQPVTGNIS